MVLEIIQLPDPRLREKSKAVNRIRQRNDLRTIAANMIDTMKAYDGVGLSAIQVGIPLRIIVVNTEPSPLILLNPEITHREGEEIALEGCLSIPGYQDEVKRAAIIKLTATNPLGHKIRTTCIGMMARVIQHEVDHLNGVLYIDRIEIKAEVAPIN